MARQADPPERRGGGSIRRRCSSGCRCSTGWLRASPGSNLFGGFSLTWLTLGVLFYPITWVLSKIFIDSSNKIEEELAVEPRSRINEPDCRWGFVILPSPSLTFFTRYLGHKKKPVGIGLLRRGPSGVRRNERRRDLGRVSIRRELPWNRRPRDEERLRRPVVSGRLCGGVSVSPACSSPDRCEDSARIRSPTSPKDGSIRRCSARSP